MLHTTEPHHIRNPPQLPSTAEAQLPIGDPTMGEVSYDVHNAEPEMNHLMEWISPEVCNTCQINNVVFNTCNHGMFHSPIIQGMDISYHIAGKFGRDYNFASWRLMTKSPSKILLIVVTKCHS